MDATAAKFEYQICNVPDENLFFKQCAVLEKRIGALSKEKLLTDVDGSLMQIYYFGADKIKVINDQHFGLSVESQLDLEEYFNSNLTNIKKVI